MFLARKCSFFCLFDICFDALAHHLADIRKYLHKLRTEIAVHGEQILVDEHLSVTACSRTDTDGRNCKFLWIS